MATRRLGFTAAVLALTLASCVSPEELRREDEAACTGLASTPARTPLLVVSNRRAWLGVTGLRPIGVIGAGDRIGRSGRFWPNDRPHLNVLDGHPQHSGEQRLRIQLARPA